MSWALEKNPAHTNSNIQYILTGWGRTLCAPNGETLCRVKAVGAERASNPHSTQHPLFTNKFAQLYAGEFRH